MALTLTPTDLLAVAAVTTVLQTAIGIVLLKYAAVPRAKRAVLGLFIPGGGGEGSGVAGAQSTMTEEEQELTELLAEETSGATVDVREGDVQDRGADSRDDAAGGDG